MELGTIPERLIGLRQGRKRALVPRVKAFKPLRIGSSRGRLRSYSQIRLLLLALETAQVLHGEQRPISRSFRNGAHPLRQL